MQKGKYPIANKKKKKRKKRKKYKIKNRMNMRTEDGAEGQEWNMENEKKKKGRDIEGKR